MVSTPSLSVDSDLEDELEEQDKMVELGKIASKKKYEEISSENYLKTQSSIVKYSFYGSEK